MKGFQDSRFLNAFHRVIAAERVGPTATRWSAGGVEWARDRHGHAAHDYSYQIEIHRLAAPRPKEWSLMVVIETWWYGDRQELTRRTHWAKLMSGKRTDALAWFRGREALALQGTER